MSEHTASEIITLLGYLMMFSGGVLLYIAGWAYLSVTIFKMLNGCEYLHADILFALLVVYTGAGIRVIGLIIE